MEILTKHTQHLSFIFSEQGIMADLDKVKVIRNMTAPILVWEVSFIGIFN